MGLLKFWLVISWPYSWGDHREFKAQAFADGDAARAEAKRYNAVLVEFAQDAAGVQTFVGMWDYEMRDDEGNPQPVSWMMNPTWIGGAWKIDECLIVRVGRDIDRKKYEEMVL